MSNNGFNGFEKFFGENKFKGLLSWLIKHQILFTRSFDKEGHLISRLFASSAFFFIPSYVSGYLLQETYNYKIMSYSIIFSLLWGLISPFLLLYAATLLYKFLQDNMKNSSDEKKWENIHHDTFNNLFSKGFRSFGLLWSTLVALIATFVYFYGSPTPIKLWAFIFSFYLSLISSLGFHGVNTIVKMMDQICLLEPKVLKFDVNHSDHFGGFSSFDRFVVRATLLFSSGTLFIPIVFDICYKCNYQYYIYLTILLVLIYIYMIGYCFFVPLFKIKNFVINEKERLIRESLDSLDEMISCFKDNDEEKQCLKDFIEILMHYHIKHSRLENIKTNPWDFKSLLEFSFSVLVPSVVTLIQIAKKF